MELYSKLSLFPQELKNLIPKSAVGTLSANSSNVINLIIDAYNVSMLVRLFILLRKSEKVIIYTNGLHGIHFPQWLPQE